MIDIHNDKLPFYVTIQGELGEVGLAVDYWESLDKVFVRFSEKSGVWCKTPEVTRCSLKTPEVGDILVLAKTLDSDFTAGTFVTVCYTEDLKYTGELTVRSEFDAKRAVDSKTYKVYIFDTCTPEEWLKANPEYTEDLNYSQIETSSKPTNPKEGAGETKTPIHLVPAEVIQGIAEALYEGSLKYGRENYLQAGVRYSTYYSATLRHLLAWFSGEDIDPDSGLEHLTKALASLSVLYSAIHRGVPDNTDDRSVVQLNDPRLTVAILNNKLKGSSDATHSNSGESTQGNHTRT